MSRAGGIGFADVGAAPAWRNLRAPLSAIPREATQVRLVATDDDLAPQHWIAVTPPRIPQLRTLQDVVGSQDPVLLDWLVGLAFPCQRPFGHQNGVVEVPKWRILPDRFGAEANSPVMDYLGGGPLGITELLLRATTVPTYLKDDWFRDWGALQRLTPLLPERRNPPGSISVSATRSGLWSPAPLRLLSLSAALRPLTGPACVDRTSRRLPSSLVPAHRIARLIAVVAGIAGLVLCALVPLLPVKQTTATIAWPQASGSDGLVSDVTAPLVSGAPRALDVVDPLPGRRHAARRRAAWCSPPFRPPASTPAATACSSRANADVVVVAFRDSVAAVAPRPAVDPAPAAPCTSGPTPAASAPTSSASPAPPARWPPEKKPQVAGVFTDLKVAAQPGLSARDRRRHPVHHLADAAQARRDGARRRLRAGLDRGAGGAGPPGRDGASPRARGDDSGASACRRGWPTSASSAPCCSGIVIGAISSDDGYNLTIARVSGDAGYTANYFRFFGATEAPFDWYQSVLAHLAVDQHRRRVDAAARHRGRHRHLADPEPLCAAAAGQAAGEATGSRCGPQERCSWRPGCRSTTACGPSR